MLHRRRANSRELPAIRPNIGIQASFRRRLMRLIEAMTRSYEHWVRAQYRATPPKMAFDAMPARELERLLREIGVRWEKRFEEAAPRLAEYFARSVRGQTERRLRQIMRDAGITVQLKMTPQLRDIMRAQVAENVSLIRSIPQQYHTQIEGMVMRSVSQGRDLKYLVGELQDQFGVTERRAKLIAMQQNNAATSAIRRERETAVGIEEGVWLHSHAGKEPRPTHLKNHGNRFSLREGWYDPDPRVRKHIWPGQLINCRCVWKAVVPGFT